jgi:AraC-like DNA-binding protein
MELDPTGGVPLRRAASLATFADAPGGQYVCGQRAVVWSATTELMGAAAWDEPQPGDIDFLVTAWDSISRAQRVAFDKILDFRAVTRVEEPTFAQLVRHAAARQRQPSLLRRQVVVAAPHVVAALAHGFWHLVPARHACVVVEDVEAGLAWLGQPAERAALVTQVLTAARDASLLTRLRGWLALHLERPSVTTAASALGVSPRTLQRNLANAETSFRAELQAARFQVAQELLERSQVKIEAIALQVGWRSASSFVRAFRERFGVTPGAWRRPAEAARHAVPGDPRAARSR